MDVVSGRAWVLRLRRMRDLSCQRSERIVGIPDKGRTAASADAFDEYQSCDDTIVTAIDHEFRMAMPSNTSIPVAIHASTTASKCCADWHATMLGLLFHSI